MDTMKKLQALEEKFFSTEQQLHAIAGALTDPIFLIDKSGKYLDVLGGSDRSAYHSSNFFTGKYLHEVLPNLAETFMQTISEAIAENSLKIIEYQLGPSDFTGSSQDSPMEDQWFEGRIFPIKDRTDEVHSVIWLSINITERKYLEEQLKELSEKDAITSAYSRRYFFQIFEHEFSIVKRSKAKLSILLIDIDNFKELQEIYGQDGGNTVLKRFVIFCEDNLRESDLFARYEGEKFIVMLPNTPTVGAAITAERIRANIEEMSVTYEKQAIKFTISIGISLVLDSDTASTDILTRADTALTQAQKKGHNRIEIS